MSHFILFNISDKDKPHIMFFLQFYINFQVLFSDSVFSPKQLDSFYYTPNLRLAAKNIPFLQKTSTPPYV